MCRFYNRVGSLECDFFFEDEYLAKIAENFRSGEQFALLMANHSFLMTGASVQETFIRSYMIEQSARTQLSMLASNGGDPPVVPSHDECMYHRRSYEGYEGVAAYDGGLEWAGLVRSLDRESKGWRGDGGCALGESVAALYPCASSN